MTAAAVLGLLIGLLLGLLGGGGSILAVPALVYGAGLPVASPVLTSLAVVGISSATAVLLRLRQVRWRIAALFGGSGAASAFAGAAVNRLLDPRLVLFGFAAVMVGAGVRMLRRPGEVNGPCAPPGGGVVWRRCVPRTAAAGLVVGFLTGLFGVGGGFVIIPALVMLLGLPMTVAVPTSLVIVVLNSAAGFLAHAGDTKLDYRIAGIFTLAAISGSLISAHLAPRVPADRLRRWFAWFIFAVAAFVVVRTVPDFTWIASPGVV